MHASFAAGTAKSDLCWVRYHKGGETACAQLTKMQINPSLSVVIGLALKGEVLVRSGTRSCYVPNERNYDAQQVCLERGVRALVITLWRVLLSLDKLHAPPRALNAPHDPPLARRDRAERERATAKPINRPFRAKWNCWLFEHNMLQPQLYTILSSQIGPGRPPAENLQLTTFIYMRFHPRLGEEIKLSALIFQRWWLEISVCNRKLINCKSCQNIMKITSKQPS